ncbi:MAG: hypothetical protein U0736_23335 [Gemmataceae bacterium]
MRRTVAVVVLLGLAPLASAGLHYSGETYADLPSRWRGFLLDQRALRQAAVAQPASALRTRYEREAARLVDLARRRTLTGDEAADLGALHLRLGAVAAALDVLRPAQSRQPTHFRLTANLGTAWHLHGNLDQAAAVLSQAVRLAPGKWLRAEQLHLRLVRLRSRDRSGGQALDDLFGVRYVGPGGRYEAGRLDAADRKALPAAAVALTQQLALWLPADGRLLWQLAELANGHGEVTTAAAMLDGCVTEFGLRAPELQAHRRILRAAADALAKRTDDGRQAHAGHALLFQPRSSRPLAGTVADADLPPIDPRGDNALAWEVLAQTTVERGARPRFARYLRELDGKRVVLRGHMQPLADNTDLGAFMLIEHPVGCWYCEMPDMIGIVLIELPEGKAGRFTRERIRVTGRLQLNASDPEKFFYVVRDATVTDEPGG